ncbi:MAG TPA: hypothetical protein VF783_08120 [Terriglobales bacterium]
MSQRQFSPMVVQVGSRRTILALVVLVSVLSVTGLPAQQQDPAPPSQPVQDATVPYSPQVQDNLPPAPPTQVPSVVVPPTLTVPAGTFVTVRLMGGLSSDTNVQGDGFSATLEQPIVVDGWVVARRGQIAVGRVVSAQKAGRVKGVSSLGVALSDLPLVDGRQQPVQSQLIQTSAGPSKGRDAAAIAGTTGLGAAIGGAVDGGAGAGIGAAAGAAAAVAGVLLTPGRPTVMPPETLLTFRLTGPVTVDTQKSQLAFQPVSQQDYAEAGGPPQLQQRPPAPPYAYPPPPGPYPYPYYPYPYAAGPYWPGWGFYPSVSFIGYYGGYGRPGYWARGGRWH